MERITILNGKMTMSTIDPAKLYVFTYSITAFSSHSALIIQPVKFCVLTLQYIALGSWQIDLTLIKQIRQLILAL